jgi:hypothetical protein
MHRSKWQALFDHLVGSCEQSWRNGETYRFCRLEVYRKFDLCWVLDRQFRGLRASNDAIKVGCRPAKCVGRVDRFFRG